MNRKNIFSGKKTLVWGLCLACLATLGCEKLSSTSVKAENPTSYTPPIVWETTVGDTKMPNDKELQEKLSELQYYVTKENGTERPFANEYWDNKAEGIYVDVISGKPLFSSTTKFKSGTGWPSFYEPIEKTAVKEVTDTTHGMRRVEVRSEDSDSHLGHIFTDGPAPTGLRYCINSASLRFVPKEKLEAEGYGELLALFK